MKPVCYISLSSRIRPNVPIEQHPWRDVWEVVQVAVLALLVYVIVWLVFAL